MCGIAGIYRFGQPAPDEREADLAQVARMLRAIEYRGPDDEGIVSLGRATLGVRRLSILDVAGGHQPISDASKRVWAVQNGEIYNFPELRADLARRHALRTRTDTELLPHLWLEHGADAVAKLRGMFATAIHDTRDGTLMLARDPLGVKPLYVSQLADRLVFASEVKAILCDPDLSRDLDPEGVARYLALGFVPGERTALAAVRKVRPGCRLLLRPDGRRDERWWAWPRFPAETDASGASDPAELAAEAGSRIAASAESMLLSDRPVGLLLSGGVDSSVLLGLLPEALRRETRTFTIGFAGGGYHDERAFARRVAEHFGSRHHEYTVPLDVQAELPRVVSMLDEPCADPAVVPAHLVARAASSEVTVLLSGTGGDEVFGGYRRYRLPSLLRRLGWLPAAAARGVATWMAERDQHRRTLAGERAIMVRKLLEARGRGDRLAAYLSALEPATPRRWSEALAAPSDVEGVAARLCAEMRTELGYETGAAEGMTFAADHLWYLPDDLLLKEDRATMGASVEGRVPYLDDALVRWAGELPVASRFGPGGEGKHVLRTLARQLLPADLAARRKHGFSVPIEDWLRGPLDPMLHEVFSGRGSGVFRPEILRRWHGEHAGGRDRAGALWAALCFELWWRDVASATPAMLERGGRPLECVRRMPPAATPPGGGARP